MGRDGEIVEQFCIYIKTKWPRKQNFWLISKDVFVILVNITIQNEKIQGFINDATSKLQIEVVNIDANKKSFAGF